MIKRSLAFGLAIGLMMASQAPAGAFDLGVGGVSVDVGRDESGGVSASVNGPGASADGSLGDSVAAEATAGGAEIGVGQDDGGGVVASAGGSGRSADIAVGGADDNLVGLTASGGAGEVGISLTNADGALLSVDNGDGSIGLGLNLGGLTGGTGGSGGDEDGGIDLWRGEGAPGLLGPGDVAALLAPLGPGQKRLLVSRCMSILSSPMRYEANMIDLCLSLAQLNTPLGR